jgi:lysophospholipase L1-like esterase
MKRGLLLALALGSGLLGYRSALACKPPQRTFLPSTQDFLKPPVLPKPEEPPWVQVIPVKATAGPPTDIPCATTGETASPNVATTLDSNGAGISAEFDYSRMLHYDAKAGATNTGLPPEVLERTKPVILSTLPLWELKGKAADLAKVQAVFKKTPTPGKPIRLMFWGASHVAGEYMTGQIRRVLQEQFGDAGHGFVMPAAPWEGYRASDINLCTGGTWITDFDNRKGGRRDGMLGPGGMSVESADTASLGWVQTTTSNPQGRQVSRFEVMFLKQPGGGTVQAVVDEAETVEIATSGDIGLGMTILEVEPGPHRLKLVPKGDGPVRLLGVNLENTSVPGVVVDAMGVNGRTVMSWNRWNIEQLQSWLSRRKPDLVVLAYGTNEANDASVTEASYERDLREALGRMRQVAPDAACVLMGPGDRGKKLSGTKYVIWGPTKMIASIQEKVAPDFGCVSWDMQAAMGGEGSVFGWRSAEPPLMASDLIHFSAAGYQELGKRFLKAAGLGLSGS